MNVCNMAAQICISNTQTALYAARRSRNDGRIKDEEQLIDEDVELGIVGRTICAALAVICAIAIVGGIVCMVCFLC